MFSLYDDSGVSGLSRRREWLRVGGLSAVGLSLSGLLGSRSAAGVVGG